MCTRVTGVGDTDHIRRFSVEKVLSFGELEVAKFVGVGITISTQNE